MITTLSKKTAMRGMLLFAIVIGCIIDRSSIIRYQSQVEQRKSAASDKQTETTQEETRTAQVQADSDLAMARAKSGCVPVVLTRNNKPVRFNESLRVFDAHTFPDNPKTPRFDRAGNPINGVQPMPQGVTVCNQDGDTALVGTGGYVTKIYRVEPSKLQEFRSYLKS